MVKSRASWPTFRYEPLKIVVSDSKLPPISKMKVSGVYFWAFCSKNEHMYDFPLPVIPRISVWATSPLCRLRKYGVLLSVSSTARYSVPRWAFVFSPGRIVNRKRQVGVVCVQKIQLAQVERVVAGYSGEVGIELVVGLGE